LQVDEVVAWDCLIKWGFEQTPGLGSEDDDRSQWNNENYEALKGTLNDLIPSFGLQIFLLTNILIKFALIRLLFLITFMKEIEEFYLPHQKQQFYHEKKQESSVSSVSKSSNQYFFNIIID